MSNDLTKIQLFFKDKLSERISNQSKASNEFSSPFSLNLFDFDLYDDDLQKITNLIILTDKFNSLNIRLSHNLSNSNTLSKLLRKISLKKQFKSLGFYIKNLNDELLNVFLEFIGKMQDSVNNLKLKIKYCDEKIEENICGKILENLMKCNAGLDCLQFEKFNFSSENNMKLLENVVNKNKCLKNLIINNCTIHNRSFSIDISNVMNLKITGCELFTINNLPIDVLNISNNNISQDGIKKIVELISDEKCSLAKLNISNNNIGDEGCIILSKGISKNNSLIALNLSSNQILNSGLIELAKSLQSETGNKTIKKLNLCKNKIEDTGLIEFCALLKQEKKHRFTKIDFNENNITDRSIIDFGEFIQNHPALLKLNISNISTEENITSFFTSCKNLYQLKKINFTNLNLTKNNSESFNNILLFNKNIQFINLINNKNFGFEGVGGIAPGIEHNSKLLSINLSHCNIGDEGVINLSNALFKNLDIREIFLIDNKIGEKGVKSLVDKLLGKTSLKILDLSFNKINPKGGMYIGEGLQDTGVQKLLLGYNKIEDEGCEFIANGLEKNKSLVELNLENNNISNKGINALCKNLKKNENLMKINLDGNKITEIDSDFYELFNWLKEIKISENPLNQSGIVRLFQGSEYNRLFTYLKFKYNNSEDDYHFKCFNENIKNIDISFNHKMNISLISHILSLKNLSKLNLQMNNITDKEIKSIINFVKDNNTPLKNLVLKNNKITPEGSIYIADLIKFSKTLKILDLSFNELKSEGVKNIFNSLINSYTLEQLFLNGNKCNDYCAEDIFNILINSNSNSNKLKLLSLSLNFFTNKGVDKILSSLRKNKTLKYLYLNENKIDSNTFKNLANYLQFNKTLKILEMKSSRINDESLDNIMKIFGINYSLEKINLYDNNLDFESVAKFGQYTSKNQFLNEINLMNNKTLKEQQKILLSSNSHLIFAN